MEKRFVNCALWMNGFLQNQVVLRSTVEPDRGMCQVNLFSLDTTGKLLCFTYNSDTRPIPDAFATTPIPGRDLASQLNNLVTDWQRLTLDFWTAPKQAVACKLGELFRSPINALSMEMLFAYHRLLACLETHPVIPRTAITDVITAHNRLKGFLDEQTREINQALLSLNTLANQ